ncbi:hypothetical protein PCASD_00900 [Puccinia coronata f. sp. avenae]|uniref:Uncharacterized protein n=1 Tax=Puccinia coronata f. sp. avenae TaxID=200324 RepID=A0A2N5VPD3_9BASI|nr:hypothetical protein PCASD_00900 [Puccinia coronata f. sp. avenae]
MSTVAHKDAIRWVGFGYHLPEIRIRHIRLRCRVLPDLLPAEFFFPSMSDAFTPYASNLTKSRARALRLPVANLNRTTGDGKIVPGENKLRMSPHSGHHPWMTHATLRHASCVGKSAHHEAAA